MSDLSRQEHRRRSRLRKRILLGVLAIGAVGAGLGTGLVMDRAVEPEPSPSPSATPTETIVIPQEVTMLTVSSTFDGQTVLSSAPLLVSVPVGLPGDTTVLVTDPRLRAVGPAGDAPLREHVAGFGPQGLAGALRNELGLRIDSVAGTTESDLVSFLEQFGPIGIDLEYPIVEGGETVYPAGPQMMEAAELVTFLAFPFDAPDIDDVKRMSLVTSAWEGISSLPRLIPRARNSRLPSEVRDALRHIAGATFLPLEVTSTDRGPVVNELGYDKQVDALEGAWLLDRDPAERPRVELRGRGLVQTMLLLIADGIRIDALRSANQRRTVIETQDEELATRLRDLIGDAEAVEPEEPLIAGLDARVTIGRGA